MASNLGHTEATPSSESTSHKRKTSSDSQYPPGPLGIIMREQENKEEKRHKKRIQSNGYALVVEKRMRSHPDWDPSHLPGFKNRKTFREENPKIFETKRNSYPESTDPGPREPQSQDGSATVLRRSTRRPVPTRRFNDEESPWRPAMGIFRAHPPLEKQPSELKSAVSPRNSLDESSGGISLDASPSGEDADKSPGSNPMPSSRYPKLHENIQNKTQIDGVDAGNPVNDPQTSSNNTSTKVKPNLGRKPLPMGPLDNSNRLSSKTAQSGRPSSSQSTTPSRVGKSHRLAETELTPEKIPSPTPNQEGLQTASSESKALSESKTPSPLLESKSDSQTLQSTGQHYTTDTTKRTKEELLALIDNKRAGCMRRAQEQTPPVQPNRKTLAAYKLATKLVEDGVETDARCLKCRDQGWPCYWLEGPNGSRVCALCTTNKVVGCAKCQDHEVDQARRLADDKKREKKAQKAGQSIAGS